MVADKMCKREDCRLFNYINKNHCSGLLDVYEDDFDCPFFKTRETHVAQLAKLKERPEYRALSEEYRKGIRR